MSVALDLRYDLIIFKIRKDLSAEQFNIELQRNIPFVISTLNINLNIH